MEPNKRIIEKVLTQALELHEKGVSLHSILRTYPAYAAEIAELFSAIALVAKKVSPIDVPEQGLARLLEALPEAAPTTHLHIPRSIKSPFSTVLQAMHAMQWKFVVPVAAVALLTGGLFLSKQANAPIPNGEVALGTPVSDTAVGGVPVPVAKTKHTGSVATVTESSGVSRMTGPVTPMAMSLSSLPESDTDHMIALLTNDSLNESRIIAIADSKEQETAFSDRQFMSDPTQHYAN